MEQKWKNLRQKVYLYDGLRCGRKLFYFKVTSDNQIFIYLVILVMQ